MFISSVKVGVAAIITLLGSAGGWGTILFAQTATDSGGDPFSTIIPATALTGTSAALVWVVKQIVGGNLVHRDPAAASAKLTEVLARSNDLAEKSIEREKFLTDFILRMQQDSNRQQRGGNTEK